MKKNFLIATAFFGAALAGYLGYQRVTSPMVSVVMLTYKRADIVSYAIESILAQTYPDYEFIILNDGSSDHTDEVVQRYTKKNSHIRYYKNDKNRGISYSRNRVTALAKGKYVMIMDDDDISLPDRMQKQVEFLENYPEIDVVAGQIKDLPRIPLNHDDIAAGLIQYNNFGNANVMYRREFIYNHHITYPDINFGEDWYFWLDVLFNGGRFAAISDDVVIRKEDSKKHYHAHPDKTYELINQFVGHFFSPQNPHLFYEVGACEKLKMISAAPVKIFSEDYLNNLIRSNCPSD